MIDKKLIYGMSIGIGAIGLLLALFNENVSIIAGFISALGATLAYLTWKFGHVMIPYLNKKFFHITLLSQTGNYEIPESQDVIIKKYNDIYYASSYILLKLSELNVEGGQQQGVMYNEQFERAISNLDYVSQISFLVYVEDISKKRKDIEAKRGELQLRISREKDKDNPDPLLIDKWERELQIWTNNLQDLIRGVRPMGVVSFVMVSAAGLSKEAAASVARRRAEEVTSVIGNALNVDTEILRAEDMIRCFEWQRFLPTEIVDLENQLM